MAKYGRNFQSPQVKIESEDDVGEIEYNPAQLTYNDIVLLHLRKVNLVSVVEFRGGFYTTVTTKSGDEKQVYIPDTRDTYCNAVHQLALLLRPKFDEEMSKKWEKFKEKIKTLQQEFVDYTEMNESVILGEAYYDKPNEKVKLEEYKQKRLKLYLWLFGALALVIEAKSFSDSKGVNLIWGQLDESYDTEKWWELLRKSRQSSTKSLEKKDA